MGTALLLGFDVGGEVQAGVVVLLGVGVPAVLAAEEEEGSWCAVGEIGLDTYWSSDFIDEQLEVLRVQLNLALRMNLPVILHVRNAMDRTIDVLREIKGLRGVFHAFSGSLESYKEIRRLGDFKIGIGGVRSSCVP